MENRLKGLKKAMKNTLFKELQFQDEHKFHIMKKIQQEQRTDEMVLIALLQLLTSRRTGFELAELLRARSIQKFEEKEGFLYTLLHRLEQKQYITGQWMEAEEKYYQLNDKGRKLLQKAERQEKKHYALEALLEG
ncbi:PadR family transcriptional regulator [Niallia nealsonii]|uniref:Lineage-specific thermal regulator protein n=1 Tax=Niallia nealsonii TaxID=115979 RepID=A0A2N0Z154_9BACI|nr:PadR family transcriptional regulator [Niallia nealsonii]PKG23250.1 lineage-specific thermal regulator protein [Niallia nealsonii]